MKKGWMIASIVIIVAVFLVIGNVSFQEKVEETSGASASGEQRKERESTHVQNEQQGSSQVPSNDAATGGSDNEGKNEESVSDLEDSSVSVEVISEETQGSKEKQNSTDGSIVHSSNGTNLSTRSSESIQEEKPNTTNNSTTNSNTSATGGSTSGNAKPEQTTSSQERETESVTSIKNRYFPDFQQLEWEHTGKLENLIRRAYEEYSSNEENFNADYYKSQGASLEAASDRDFYHLYGQMQRELTENGHSKNAATDFEQSYQAKKEAREDELRNLMN